MELAMQGIRANETQGCIGWSIGFQLQNVRGVDVSDFSAVAMKFVQSMATLAGCQVTGISRWKVGNQACACAAVQWGGSAKIAHAELRRKAIMNPTTNASRFDGDSLSISWESRRGKQFKFQWPFWCTGLSKLDITKLLRGNSLQLVLLFLSANHGNVSMDLALLRVGFWSKQIVPMLVMSMLLSGRNAWIGKSLQFWRMSRLGPSWQRSTTETRAFRRERFFQRRD